MAEARGAIAGRWLWIRKLKIKDRQKNSPKSGLITEKQTSLKMKFSYCRFNHFEQSKRKF